VRDIQQELTDKGYDLGKVDGVWGNKSINALRKFQKDPGLSSTGVADSRTVEQLFPVALQFAMREMRHVVSAITGRIIVLNERKASQYEFRTAD
jgi:peptidoglycan hydrolase-like protein with peptidoglycan-binding domain